MKPSPVISRPEMPGPQSAEEARARSRQSWRRGFAVYAWITLSYTLAVILWGAYVRAAGAGNGCGANWPLCDGQFLPNAPTLKMLIEFLHRISSGLDGVLVLGLVAGALWLYPRRHGVRRAAFAAGVLIVIEALLGAALVLFGWVGNNASAARVSADALHLVNTLLLLGALLLSAMGASGVAGISWRGQGRKLWLLGGALAAVIGVAVCGVMVALADTLYPTASLSSGLRRDWSAAAPLLERLRVIHPTLALLTGLFLVYMVIELLPRPQAALTRRLGYAVVGAVVVQWGLGALDVLWLTPIGLQVLHLLGADLLWLALVGFSAAQLTAREPSVLA